MATPVSRTAQPRMSEQLDTRYNMVNGGADYGGYSAIPTDTTQGAIRTEYRGVFLSNLSYEVQDKELTELFSLFGEVTRLVHKKEDKVNSKGRVVVRSKGSAIATFKNSQDAAHARAQLNGRTWKDRVLAARFDTESTPVNAVPRSQHASFSSTARRTKASGNDGTPLIVDGSNYGRDSDDSD
jgi:RNA recognition motif-containing protein